MKIPSGGDRNPPEGDFYVLAQRDRNCRVRSIPRVVDHLPGVPLLHDDAAVHEDQPVRHVPGEGHLVGHHDHGGAAVGQLADDPQHLAGKLRIQGGGGLVEAQHVRLHAQSPGDGHPLLLAAGELVGIVARPVGQAHLLQQSQPPVPDVRLRFAGCLDQTPGQGHVFQGGVLWKQVEILEHQTEMQALFPQLPLPHRGAGPRPAGSGPAGRSPRRPAAPESSDTAAGWFSRCRRSR